MEKRGPGSRGSQVRAIFPHMGFLLPALGACLSFGLLVRACSLAVLFSPPATPILEDRYGGFLSEGVKESANLGYWELEGELNPRLVQCLISIEDQRFSEHLGVDFRSFFRSLANNASGKPRQGASTIPMQVARLQYPGERTLAKKAMESLTALFLVAKYGRQRVLRHYLKILPQGNLIFGVSYAARRYFRKPQIDLSLAEAAVLAALPNAPGRMNLFSSSGFSTARSRASLIVRKLLDGGSLPVEEGESALRDLAEMERPVREDRPENSYHFVLRALKAEAKEGTGRYSTPIRTSLDPGIQSDIQRIALDAVFDNSGYFAANIAVVVADAKTGEILGYLGSAGFFDEANSGSIDYASLPRSAGSTLKPFLYAYGLDTGKFTPSSIIADLPFSVLDPGGEYRAANFDDDYLGPMIYRRALANSRNIPALRVMMRVGTRGFFEFLYRLGLVHDEKGPEYYGAGLAIGGLYVGLADLVSAYGVLGNGGVAFPLRWKRGEGGTDAAASVGSGERLLSSYSARSLCLFLQDNTARAPSFPRMSELEYPYPVAVKTGTSQGFRDAWAIGMSRKYLVGIWMGRADNAPMNKVAGLVAARYVKKVFDRLQPLQKEGIDAEPFPPPEGCIPVELCVLSGKDAGPNCPVRTTEYFRPFEAPLEACDVHLKFAVDSSTGSLAAEGTAPDRIAVRNYTVLSPEFLEWGSRRGFEPPAQDKIMPGEVIIVTPQNGSRYLIDPSIPANFQTIPLHAKASGQVEQVEWYLDGKLFGRSGSPYSLRLPLSSGTHLIQAAISGSAAKSETVEILVE